MPGISSPQDASHLAAQVSGVLTYFQNAYGINFSGVDLDIEAATNTETNVAAFIQDLRSNLGANKIISLTIPGQAWTGFYRDLATDPIVKASVDSYQFMEYDIWNGSDSFEDQIKADIGTYIGASGAPAPSPNGSQTCWGLPPSKIHLGLMPGNDDEREYLSLQAAQDLAQFAKDQGLGGIMIWDSDRDAGTSGNTGNPPFTYSQDILAVLT